MTARWRWRFLVLDMLFCVIRQIGVGELAMRTFSERTDGLRKEAELERRKREDGS